ncbi:MAG: hypothetical protein MJ077_11200 [Oscillospiraceae bacterium]|nr:hypothetical protein [Oscillospiraceae bacterium]
MDRNTSNTLLSFAILGLAVGGLILILVEIFSETKDLSLLNYGFMAILLANLFVIIRYQRNHQSEKKNLDTIDTNEEEHHE